LVVRVRFGQRVDWAKKAGIAGRFRIFAFAHKVGTDHHLIVLTPFIGNFIVFWYVIAGKKAGTQGRRRLPRAEYNSAIPGRHRSKADCLGRWK
jgi:hypothetical protein